MLQTVIFVVVLLVAIPVVHRFYNRPKALVGKPVETTVLLEKKIRYGSGYAFHFLFKCANEENSFDRAIELGIIEGERFMAVYDSLNCENVKVDYSRPVFLSTENTIRETGQITKVGSAGVMFTYPVKGEIFEKVQYMEKDYRKMNPEIHVGANFPVSYWTQNPKRAIMYFE